MDVLELPDGAAWDAWLVEHREAPDAWLRIGKRNAGAPYLSIGDALDVALCHGWIDGHRKGLDDVSFLQRYSPRRKGSSWSAVNVGKVEALIAAGRMRSGGLAEIALAKEDGRWQNAYASQATAEVPDDLAAALAADPAAAAAFAELGRSERYALILPVLKARTTRTRATAVQAAIVGVVR